MTPAYFSNFGSLKSTETDGPKYNRRIVIDFSNFGSLKSTETGSLLERDFIFFRFQQFRLVEEH